MYLNFTNDSFSNLTIPLEEHPVFSFSTIFRVVTLILILVAAFIGNILVLVVFLRKPSLLSVSNRFILQLTLCNFCMTVLLMPSAVATTLHEQWLFSHAWCVCTGFFIVLFFAATIFTLVMITVDRYVAVVTPLHYYQRITSKRSYLMLISVWFIAALLALPPLIVQDSINYHEYRYSCTIGSRANHIFTYGYNIFLILCGFLVPLSVMSFAYYRIYTAARDLVARDRHRWYVLSDEETVRRALRAKKRPRNNGNTYQHHSSSWRLHISGFTASAGFRKILRIHVGDEWRTAKSGLVILFTFMVTWLPFFVVIAIESVLGGDQHVSPTWEWVSLWLAFCSCACNPYVYVFRSTSMRHHALAPFGMGRRMSQESALQQVWIMYYSQRRASAFRRPSMVPPPPSCPLPEDMV
ncbi:G-protein coupled receptor 161-like [Amphiura filiformis]|uniref:G-protein coupled receptor 161-like n=1 Tax=Amphiura filiformis TaxID=82378 RepID=UPI003B20E9F2